MDKHPPLNDTHIIDNQNLYANLGNWQSLLGYIPQDIYLIDDTVLKNVAFGIDDKYVEKNRVESALKSAQIYNFVSSLPEGLNAIVGNRGVKLSGGQKQRIGIARALYRNPRILVLDEATSSLDIETESNFMKNIYDLRGKKTLIISTHRLSTLKKERNNDIVQKKLLEIENCCINNKNLMPAIINAALEYATLGEIVNAMKKHFGEWNEKTII